MFERDRERWCLKEKQFVCEREIERERERERNEVREKEREVWQKRRQDCQGNRQTVPIRCKTK